MLPVGLDNDVVGQYPSRNRRPAIREPNQLDQDTASVKQTTIIG